MTEEEWKRQAMLWVTLREPSTESQRRLAWRVLRAAFDRLRAKKEQKDDPHHLPQA